MKTRVSLKYLLTDCLWTTFFDPKKLSHTLLHLISSTILVSVSLSKLFQAKVRASTLQKREKPSLS